MIWKRLLLTLDMIKFEHSVFALPFALTGALLAFREEGYPRAGMGWKVLWIVVAMVGARSAAMAFNRLVDAPILWLTAAVTFWTAGFDIIYSCQDYEFDSAEALFSVPRVLGIAGALRAARGLHVLMVICLLALVASLHLGALAVAGVAAVV